MMDIDASRSMKDAQMRMSSKEVATERSRFGRVLSAWALSDDEASRLLGSPVVPWLDGPRCAEIDARMSLVLDVDALLGLLVDESDLATWLRRPHDAFSDGDSPLVAMSSGWHAICGLRNVLMDISRGKR